MSLLCGALRLMSAYSSLCIAVYRDTCTGSFPSWGLRPSRNVGSLEYWRAVEGVPLEESEARRRAEEFGRTLTDRWDEWAFELNLWTIPAVTGVYGFTWSPTAKDELGRQIRVGGNWPILVDRETGACRVVQGSNEMATLRGTSGVRTAR